MQLSIIFIDVKASKIEYTGAYQNGILFNPDYLDYEILSTPLDASEVKASGEYLQFLSTGTYRIKLKFKSEYADQIEAGLVGWAKTDWTEALENKESIEIEFTVAKGSLALPEAESKIYNAKAWTLSNAVGEWCSEAHCNENVVELRKVEYKNFASGAAYAGISKENIIKAGYYRITLVVKDKHNYMWSDTTDGEKSFDLTINKAKILMNQPRVDEYGILADGERITAKSGILPTDAGAMNADGVYGLEYIAKGDVEYDTWTRSAPENAGEYYVRPYIVSPDDCNYEIDYQITNNVGTCYTLFERLKNTIAIPFLWKEGASIDNSTYTTSTPYTGAKQTFKLVNTKADDDSYYLSEGIEVASMEGGIAQTDASTFEATNMQTYRVEVKLVDPANTRWATGEKDNTENKTLTLIINKAYLHIGLEYNGEVEFVDGQSFSKGEHETLVLSAGEILSGVSSGQSKVTLDVTYSNSNGGSGIIADTQMTIDGKYFKANIDLMTLPVGT